MSSGQPAGPTLGYRNPLDAKRAGDRGTAAEPAGLAPPVPAQTVAGLKVVSPGALGAYPGTWEILQQARFTELYARHYGWSVVEQHGVLVMARKLPVIGSIRAKAFSPEAGAGANWHGILSDLHTGRIEVMTNVSAPPSVATPSSPLDLYSMVVDLRPGASGVFASFEPRVRNAIRRSQRENMTVRPADQARDLARFHEVLTRVTRSGVVYEAMALSLLQSILAEGFARLYVVEYRGQIVGGAFLLVNRHSHAYQVAFDRQACNGLPGNLLWWGAIQGEIEAGMPYLDLGAQSLSMQPALTLAKRGYSPCLVPAYRYEVVRSRWREAIADGWRWLRRAPAGASPAQIDAPPR